MRLFAIAPGRATPANNTNFEVKSEFVLFYEGLLERKKCTSKSFTFLYNFWGCTSFMGLQFPSR